jgi:hypothetical protein
MTSTKTATAFYFLMGLLSLFGCTGKSDRTNKSELDYISFKELSKKAYAYLNKQQDSCDQLYKISTYEHWFYEQATGELTFSDSGVNKVIIDYEEVGSVSFKSNTWLWAWENPHLDKKIKAEIVKVRDYGFRRSFNSVSYEGQRSI